MSRYGIFKFSKESFALGSVSHSMESIGPETTEVVNPIDNEVVSLNDGGHDAEMGQALATISNEVDEIQRAVTAHDMGEQTAQIAQAIGKRGNVTQEEAALVQAGAAQTVIAAGGSTDDATQAAETVATESWGGGFTYSAEGFVETLKKIWQNIKDFVARVLQGIKNMWNRWWNSTAKMKKRAEELKKKANDDYKSEKKSKDSKIESWKGYMKTLSLTDGIKFDIGQLVSKAKEYESNSSDVGSDVKECIKSLTDSTKLADSAKTEGEVEKKITELLDKIKAGSGIGQGSRLESRHLGEKMNGAVSKLPLNNFGLAYGYRDNKGDVTINETINSYTVKAVDVHQTFNPKKKEVKEEPLSHANIVEICDHVIGIANGLDDWYNKGSKTADDDIQKLRKQIDEATSKVNDEGTGAARNAIKAIQRLFVIPTQLLRGSMAICSHFITVGNAFVSAAEDSLSHYEKKDSKKD